MSGGYYDYLYHKCADRSLSLEDLATIEQIAADLEEEGFKHAAERSRAVVAKMLDAYTTAQDLMFVWEAQEWYKSNDWSIDQVKEHNDKYLMAERIREILEAK